MNAKDVIRFTLDRSNDLTMKLLADMKNECLTMPTPRGGNHPLWVLGHLALAEAGILSKFVTGGENPLAKWKDLFGGGSEPVADAKKYPSWDEVLRAFEQARANTLKTLERLSEADLDRPTNAPENMKAFFGTVGQVFAFIPVHAAMHAGQVTDARRAAGKKPLLG